MNVRTRPIFDEKELQERMKHARRITREEFMEQVRKDLQKKLTDASGKKQ